jgi:hypothetical protein
MPGLDPGIHAPPPEPYWGMIAARLRVDGRVKPGHDDKGNNPFK